MVQFNEKRNTAVLYTSATCNLNCRYCQIDKNPVLVKIDKELEKSFQSDYYFNRIKTYFPRRDQLKRVETWGGEPFLHMDRIYPLVHQLIEYYPYFNTMFSSTNFSYETWLEQFMGLMQCFADYPDREFSYILQLSVDGPPKLNDRNRGKGVTDKCIANFNKLVQIIAKGQFPKNIKLEIDLKGTWDLECIHELNDKEKLIQFFQFYENTYMEPIIQLNNPKIDIPPAIPNTAVPSPVTKKDGQIFAQLIKKCREIERDNLLNPVFKYYTHITPFNMQRFSANLTYQGNAYTCGSGATIVGFLPNNMISTCHEGFTQFILQYKELAAHSEDKDDKTIMFDKYFNEQKLPMCATDEKYNQHEKKMECYGCRSSAQLVNDVSIIMALALAEQIEPQYLDEKLALRAAIYLQENTAFCIKDNYNINGSFTLQPVGMYKLLLNGALQLLISQEDFYGALQ